LFVTELIQPLAAVPSPRDVVGNGVAPDPSFAELVYAHFAWWQQLRRGSADGPQAAAYRDVLGRFERSRGQLIHSFWCSHLESAVALTELPRRSWWRRRELRFHRESDWATKEHPEVAAQLYRCDELAVRAQAVLTGVRQRICLQLVTSSAAHLLSLVDAASGHRREADTAVVLERERSELDKAEAYYRHAANGQAQIAYFAGMAFVAGVVALIAGLILMATWTSGVAALTAGAVGAVVSVVQRINAGDFDLEYDVGRPYAFFLGGLRPLIGGAFAVAISFAITGGLLHLPVSSSDPSTNQRLALIVLSFLAGFSERWAQDTLATTLPQAAAPKGPAAAPDNKAAKGQES
jgi:hypothetical protein